MIRLRVKYIGLLTLTLMFLSNLQGDALGIDQGGQGQENWNDGVNYLVNDSAEPTKLDHDDLGCGKDAPGNKTTELRIVNTDNDPNECRYEIFGRIGPEYYGSDTSDWYIFEYIPDSIVTIQGLNKLFDSNLKLVFRYEPSNRSIQWITIEAPYMTFPSPDEYDGNIFICIEVDHENDQLHFYHQYEFWIIGELQTEADSGADASDSIHGPNIPMLDYYGGWGRIGGSFWDDSDHYKLWTNRGEKLEINIHLGESESFFHSMVYGYRSNTGSWDLIVEEHGEGIGGVKMELVPSDHDSYYLCIKKGYYSYDNVHRSSERVSYEVVLHRHGSTPSIHICDSFVGNNAIMVMWRVVGEETRIMEFEILREFSRIDFSYLIDAQDNALTITKLEPTERFFIDDEVCSGGFYKYRVVLRTFNGENYTSVTVAPFFSDDRDRDIDRVIDEIEYKYGFSSHNWTDGLDDTDKDGYHNYEEIERYSNPFDVSSIPGSLVYHELEGYLDDKDLDGIPNDWEELQSLDPLDSSDAKMDPDRDGRTNLEEFKDGTDPNDIVKEEKKESIIEKELDGPWMRSIIALLILFSLLTVVILIRSRMSRSMKNSRRGVPGAKTRKAGTFQPRSFKKAY